MRMHRPTAIFGSDPQALARISPSRAADYLRCFITTVAGAVPKFPALGLTIEEVNEASLMLDIIERTDPTLRQLQSVSKQIADIATTIQQQQTNMTFTVEILCLMVEVLQNHAPSVIADVFKAWTRSTCGIPSSAPSSPDKAPIFPDSEEFFTRNDPIGERFAAATPSGVDSPLPTPHRDDPGLHHPLGSSLPPSDPWSSSSLHGVPASSPQPTVNQPLNFEDTWKVPPDWDARGRSSRRLRREGAFIHTPDWDAMSKTYGRGDDAAEDDRSHTPTTNDVHISTAMSPEAHGRTHKHEMRERASSPTQLPASISQSRVATDTDDVRAVPQHSDSPDATELRRCVHELQAYIDAGYEGRLPRDQNKMKEASDASSSHNVPSSNSNLPVTLESPTPMTPRKKRQRASSQSPSRSPFHYSPGSHAGSAGLPEDEDEGHPTEARAVKRMKVSAPTSTPGPAPTPENIPASASSCTPEPTLTPEISATASGVNSGTRSPTPPRRRSLTRTATMDQFD
ncbi:hypothetical protein M404DRAFT_32981 [Pisolithus tinctorius Marx 270]|uniref:Uncharacterized protein n=1 Tax=Pisolithus tinctorius Marx 270 TaxID=870435 RepID=A0A0C3JGL4_PISTI|nr:hypothetical protein M404DRAFT_32981 [Pisolithus tinctorius Marx 270]